MLAKTQPPPLSEPHKRPLHRLDLFLVLVEPAVGVVALGIGTEDAFVLVHGAGQAAGAGARGEVNVAGNGDAAGGHGALEWVAGDGAEAHGFADGGIEVGELAELCAVVG